MQKQKVGIYIDGANAFYQSKKSGWHIDYEKLFSWVNETHELVVKKYFIGTPNWEPAKTINNAFNSYLKNLGCEIITKPLKKIKTESGYKNKCNFDVEIHDEIINDLLLIDVVYLVSGDSDFLRTKERVLKSNKKIKFLVYKKEPLGSYVFLGTLY